MENGQPCSVAGANDRTVAWVDFWQDKSYASQLDIDEQKANAELIAQAPDLLAQRNALLEALQAMLNAADGFDSLQDDDSRAEAYADELTALFAAKDHARNAIALAQGVAK